MLDLIVLSTVVIIAAYCLLQAHGLESDEEIELRNLQERAVEEAERLVAENIK